MDNWKQLQIFSKNECNKYIDKIYKLKHRWISRCKSAPFYTLGMAAYLDGKNDYNDILKRDIYNRILSENFNDLYIKVVETLSIVLNTKVELYDKSAIPGFHIFLPHGLLKDAHATHGKTPHIDTQFKYVFPEKGIKQEDFISFTLTLSCGDGSGLNIWKPEIPLSDNVLDSIDVNSIAGYQGQDALSRYSTQAVYSRPTFIRYNIGSIFIHHGIFFHYPVLSAEKIARITLQGHGVKRDEKFLLFW